MDMINHFFNDESGATMTEYAILVSLLAIAVIAAVAGIAIALNVKFEEVRAAIVAIGS